MRLTRDQLRARWRELREIVSAWDPIGVMGDPDWPRDEYECLVGPVLRRLEEGATADEIGAFLAHELEHHFGLDPGPHEPRAFAERLVRWYAERWPGSEPVPAPEQASRRD